MFLEVEYPGFPGIPEQPPCAGCKAPIQHGEKTTEINLAVDPEHGLHELNGSYHEHCARPLVSVLRAYEMCSRLF